MAESDEPIRVLLVEDSEFDAELILDELLGDGLSITSQRVDREPEFVEALARFSPHVIVSDLSMPEFSGYRALEIARELKPRIPFLFVSGTMGEEAAVEALRGGATDYVLKHSLTRFASAVRRALAAAADHDARERAEEDLLRIQRYESLALLASGLSHDLRNILQPISLCAQMLATDERDDVRKAAQLITECTQGGLDIVASMLSFARGSQASRERLKVSALLEALAMLLRGSMPRSVTLRMDLPSPTIEVDGNHTEMQQCLLNLCLNAIQAMPDGGELHVEATLLDLEPAFFLPEEAALPGRYLRISVKDTGIGMPEDVRSNLFKPFFTTKERGTGLGLISCKRILTNHNGFIRVSSEVGAGTTFSLFLPAPPARALEMPSRTSPLGQGEVVLLVIEEATMLSLLRGTVEAQGYKVFAAQSGAAALQTIETHGLPDIVVMEADMNLMTGVRTATTLIDRKYHGSVLMIAKSGSIDRTDLPPLQRIRFIDRPVDPAQLLQALAEELGG
jgi:signal transduction histidine kinase